MQNNLIFRRQFIIAREPLEELAQWNNLRIDSFYIYVHPDIEMCSSKNKNRNLALIGNIYDSSNPEKGNYDILQSINANTNNYNDLFLQTKTYVGRYVIFYRDDHYNVIFSDALGLREIYFCTDENRIVCASQPNLIVMFAIPKINSSVNSYLLEYFNTHAKNGRWNSNYKWIGDESFYDGIKHLLPNHYFNITDRTIRRYWPSSPLKKLPLDDAVLKCCSFLKGALQAMSYRHSLMQAITAGTDSRILLAASKNIKDKIYYFINDHGLGQNHPDIAIPKDICEKLGISFHIHNVPEHIDDEFKQIFLNNTFFASDRILSTIYNIYYKLHSDKVNVLGIGEIGRTRYGIQPKHLHSYRLIYKLGYREGQYIISQAEKILKELLPVCNSYNINAMTLFYWEHTLGNWGATGNSESDIAIEEINPFCSHLLYETLLSVDDQYSDYNNPVIFREMIKMMWPELLDWPINPAVKMQDRIKRLFFKIGLKNTIQEMKYRACYLKYKLSAYLRS